MSDFFKIYVDRLQGGKVEKIDQSFSPEFMEIHEKELGFIDPVLVQGKAYLTDDHLILCLQASTTAKMPCSICNQMTKVPIHVENFYYTKPISELAEPIYDYRDELREAILLELPHFVECEKKCPERKNLDPYLKKSIPQKANDSDSTYYPFSDLDNNSGE